MKESSITKYKDILQTSPATLAIIIVNIIVFIAIKTNPGIAEVLLLYPEYNIILARPWTLITVFFSHEVFVHLLVNMGLLFVFGVELERVINSRRVPFVYLISGLIGSIAFAPYAQLIGSTGTAVGASAAAWGVASAFAAIYPNKAILKGKAKHWVLALFIGNIMLAINNPQMSVGAGTHSVGIIVGLLYGFWFKHKGQSIMRG